MATDGIPVIPMHPREVLLHEFMEPMGVTQTALARHIDVPIRRVNEICRGKRGITAETAWLLGQAFGVSAQSWLNLQSLYDLAMARKEHRLRNVPVMDAASV